MGAAPLRLNVNNTVPLADSVGGTAVSGVMGSLKQRIALGHNVVPLERHAEYDTESVILSQPPLTCMFSVLEKTRRDTVCYNVFKHA
ncbi:Uncharacterised protein [Mycobacteroides abscessus subsp. abscessus]|nr:Uncharacterised protein [Mycobacteroides abscessus subsp. abscessus]SIF38705.1 Uncharacterised protein [Mycobacteroides abscessus subsp. abscessus]SIF83720.1 Uncharacterised protein [Mycobacteroides abscessus subsp. abscessus]